MTVSFQLQLGKFFYSIGGVDYDVYCASPSPFKRNEFKTPLTSRYSNKASVTPSLFSPDESVHLTPVLSECPVKCM